jgi:hypothetical protein
MNAKRKRWPEEAEQRRIESVALFLSIRDLADVVFAALEAGDAEAAAAGLGRLRGQAAKGAYLLKDMPAMWAYDNEIE